MKTSHVLAACALTAAAQPLVAQSGADFSEKAQAAAFAISSTPVGAVPRLITAQSLGTSSGTSLRLQFGNIDEAGDFSRRIFLGGIDLPVGRATVGVSAGFLDFACGDSGDPQFKLDCKGGFILGAHAGTPLVTAPLGTANAAAVTVGIDGSVGFGTGDILDLTFDDGFGSTLTAKAEATSMALGLSLPVALVAKGSGVTVAPHITPGVGYGRLKARVTANDPSFPSESNTESSARFMLGGGAAILLNNSGLGLHLGLQKVFAKDAESTLSFGLSYTLR